MSGLKGDTNDRTKYQKKWRDILGWAKDERIDALCIQEHNCGTAQFGRLKQLATAFQYCLILAHREGEVETEEGSRGGAALLLNRRSFEAGAEEDEEQTAHDGRIAMREVAWEGMLFKIASMYVPAEADYRKRFINKMNRSGTLDKDTIVGGDYNCVIRVQDDVLCSEERARRQPYANAHGPLLTN